MTEKQTAINEKSKSAVTWGPAAAILVTAGVYVGGQVIGYLLFIFIYSLYGTLKLSGLNAGQWADSINALLNTLAESESQLQTAFQFTLVLFVEAVTFALIYAFLRYRKASLRATGLLKPKLRDAKHALAGFAVYLPIYIASLMVITRFIPTLNVDQEQQLGFDKANTPPELLLVFISLVIFPPLIEEILARGFLYGGLRTKLPVIYAALITSILFGAAHLQFGSGEPLLWVAAIDTFILSMVLVYMRERSGSLWPPIGLHMIKNGLAFLLVFVLKVQ